MSNLRATRFSDIPLAIIDFETTGLSASHDRIVEASVVHVDDQSRVKARLNSLVNPQQPIDPRAIAVHGITDADVVDAPDFAGIADSLLDAIEGRVLVAYNAAFDLRFLRSELARVGLGFETAFICAMELRQLIFADRRRKLTEACEEVGVDLRSAHSAAADAVATGELTLKYFQILEDEGITNFEALSRFGHRAFLGSLDRPTFSVKTAPTVRAQAGAVDADVLRLTAECEKMNEDLEQRNAVLDGVLAAGVTAATQVHWGQLMLPVEFSGNAPAKPTLKRPAKPDVALRPDSSQKPSRTDDRYAIDEDLMDQFLPWRVAKKEAELEEQYRRDVAQFKERVHRWNAMIEEYKSQCEAAKREYAAEVQKYRKDVRGYKERCQQYRRHAIEHNAQIEKTREGYEQGAKEAVANAVQRILLNSQLPEDFPDGIEVTCECDGEVSVVRELPTLEVVPTVKSYKFVKKSSAITEQSLSDAARKRQFDSIVYQLMLRTIHEVFFGDAARKVNSVTVRGVVDGFDPATGHHAQLVIARCTCDRQSFTGLRLKNVDPKTCFKELKGKTKGRPSALQPIEVLTGE